MKIKNLIWLFISLLALNSCTTIYKKMNIEKEVYERLEDGLYAKMETSKGDMIIRLEEKEAPVTVANFVGLAQGKLKNSSKPEGTPFYDGTIFHRVIKNFMIQGGDPKGTGMGDPGYKFDDEVNGLTHSGKGILSMANSGPNTNGSQFFITHTATPHLDGRHTVFGKVVVGEDVVDAIANTETGGADKPKTDVVLKHVLIFTKGDAYKNYDAVSVFTTLKGKIKDSNAEKMAAIKAAAEKKAQEFSANQDKWAKEKMEGMEALPSGMYIKKTHTTDGEQVNPGDNVKVHYAGRLLDGTEFDNSYKRNEPILIPIGAGRVIKGWDEGITKFKVGEKGTLLIPPNMGYGAQGAGGVIPGNAWLEFDIEIVGK